MRIDACRQKSLCQRCSEGIAYLMPPLCRVCGMELAGGKDRDFVCGECLRAPPAYHLARSLVRYESAVQQLVKRLKFAGDTSVAHGISAIMRRSDLTEFEDCDWIIPVPLHADRHRRRGLNQATLLADLFFPKKREAIRSDWLVRTRNTTAQTRLGGIARRKNMSGAFQLRKGIQLERKILCLVDDVFTTGTTVEECTKVLIHHGALRVKVLTLARAPMLQRGRVG
ncbi:MAG: ComF family protein [Proteobacteria bacterium]|nr:ComF family protein [Pseudomonadota bacterium]